MFHKIVVALDYSEFSGPILDEAISLGQLMGAHLILLNVLSLDDRAGYQFSVYPEVSYLALNATQFERYREEWTEFKNRSLHLLEADLEVAKAAGVNADLCQLDGSPGRSICEYAKSWDADLILMGRHGRTGISELFLGSVSNYVLHHAHCAVLTLNVPSTPPEEKAEVESLTTGVST
jgi:nucleotide-binding universal stress UspA family protein